jgi:AcrR family transcriptional regulator
LTCEKRRKREKDIKRNNILKAARKLFFEKGFKSVTVESIAKKAEVSKGSLYLHFKSKDEIYSQILLSDIDKFHGQVSGLFGNGSTASAILLRLSDIYVDFFFKDRELFRILMTFMLDANHRKLPDDIQNHIIKTTNKTIDIIESILQYGIENHEFSEKINLRQNRNAIWGLLNGIISLYIFTASESKRENLIRSTIQASMEVFIRGLKKS